VGSPRQRRSGRRRYGTWPLLSGPPPDSWARPSLVTRIRRLWRDTDGALEALDNASRSSRPTRVGPIDRGHADRTLTRRRPGCRGGPV
jgi:hypothetical protein